MTDQAIEQSLTELRLREMDVRQELIEHIRKVQKRGLWKSQGCRSIKEFCMKILDFTEIETREVLVGAGVIMTSAQLSDSDPAIQKRIDTLKEWRKQKASAMKLSAFLILSNRTLMTIAKENPVSTEALVQIPGVGPKKIENYGDEILRCLAG
jgi:superfamily II DNA helicase RecQ